MNRPKWISFDCYGTLTDFDLNSATRQILGSRVDGIDVDAFFQTGSKIRYQEAVLADYQPYRDLLRRSLERTMHQFGLTYSEDDGDALVAAVPTFGPFPDVPPVLERLKDEFKIAIISNTDDDLIVGNVEKIGVPFDRVITAEQARAYKPNLPAFRYMLAEFGCDPNEVLHVAQGFDYDIWPAHYLGWSRVWINRREYPGDLAFGPYEELRDLSGLPDLLGMD